MTEQLPSFLAPLDADEFFSHYWEKQPLHISREGGSVTELIDMSAVETLLSTQPLYFPGVQLTQSGETIDVNSYADEQNVIMSLRLLERHRQGATIVLSQAQKLFAPLGDLCREVIRALRMNCQANVYLSPPAKQGFNAHYDTHDVFILQVSGAKTFNFYPSPVNLPCPDEKFDAGKLQSVPMDESIRLTAGDTLYIPRGIVHDAVADDADSSIHVTLGIYPVLMRDVLLQVVTKQASLDSRLRQSVNPFTASQDIQKQLQTALQVLLEQTGESAGNMALLREVMTELQDELSLDAPQDCKGTMESLSISSESGSPLPEYQRVLLRQDMIINYQNEPPLVKIHTFGQIMDFNEPYSGVVAKLLSQGELTTSELGDLSEDHREALLRRLLQENLIKLA